MKARIGGNRLHLHKDSLLIGADSPLQLYEQAGRLTLPDTQRCSRYHSAASGGVTLGQEGLLSSTSLSTSLGEWAGLVPQR